MLIDSPLSFPGQARLSPIVTGLSLAIDLSLGQPVEHSVRSCYIAMRLAEAIGIPDQEQSDLFYGVLLKDVG